MNQSEPSSFPVFAPETNEHMLKSLRAMLGDSLQLVDRDGVTLELSPSILAAMQQVVRVMSIGRSVAILPYEQYVSCQKAAELLGISRPFLYKLLDRGVIPSFRVGSHRRLRFEDVIDYKLSRSQERNQALLELAELSKRLGLLPLDDF